MDLVSFLLAGLHPGVGKSDTAGEECAAAQNKLRLIASASEPLSSDLPNRWRKLQSGVHLINMFGQTETTGIVATYPIGTETQARKIVPIGRPIANTQIYILDAYMRPVPLGVVGEMCIGGNGVARGYLGRNSLRPRNSLPTRLASATARACIERAISRVIFPMAISSFSGEWTSGQDSRLQDRIG